MLFIETYPKYIMFYNWCMAFKTWVSNSIFTELVFQIKFRPVFPTETVIAALCTERL